MSSTVNQKHDVIIVGAGVVGSSLAFALGRNHPQRDILVIERDLREPDRIVGELLQPGGYEKLRELGLGECTYGIDAVEVFGYAVIMNSQHGSHPELQNRKENQKLTYPEKNGQQMMGRSFHHGRFIQKLRQAAQSLPNVTMVEGTVTQLVSDQQSVVGVSWKNKDNEIIQNSFGKLNIVCDGCLSNLRSKIGAGEPSSSSSFVGFILENCKLPYPGYGHVFLASPGPVLAYQIGTNEIRFLIDIPRPMPCPAGELPDYILKTTVPQLPEEIRPAFIEAIKNKKPRSMYNNRLHPQDNILKPGLAVIGDAWNMRHPLTGGGMTVAFNDVVLVRDALQEIEDLNDTKRVMNQLHKRYVIARRPFASSINILAGALYSVFVASSDPVLPVMRVACLDYFKFGGSAVSGPMSLLGGYCGKPAVLLYHFFCVALYGVFKLLQPFP